MEYEGKKVVFFLHVYEIKTVYLFLVRKVSVILSMSATREGLFSIDY